MWRGTPAEAELYQVRTYEVLCISKVEVQGAETLTSRNPSRATSYVMFKIVKSFDLFSEEQVQ